MPQSPLISFEYVVQNELQQQQQSQQQGQADFINGGATVMTHPTVNGNVKHSTNGINNPAHTRPGYQVFRQPKENLEVWLHGPR